MNRKLSATLIPLALLVTQNLNAAIFTPQASLYDSGIYSDILIGIDGDNSGFDTTTTNFGAIISSDSLISLGDPATTQGNFNLAMEGGIFATDEYQAFGFAGHPPANASDPNAAGSLVQVHVENMLSATINSNTSSSFTAHYNRDPNAYGFTEIYLESAYLINPEAGELIGDPVQLQLQLNLPMTSTVNSEIDSLTLFQFLNGGVAVNGTEYFFNDTNLQGGEGTPLALGDPITFSDIPTTIPLDLQIGDTVAFFISAGKDIGPDAFDLLPGNYEFNATQNLSMSFSLVSPVPEMETWAMMIAGLGFMGWQLKRRQQSVGF